MQRIFYVYIVDVLIYFRFTYYPLSELVSTLCQYSFLPFV